MMPTRVWPMHVRAARPQRMFCQQHIIMTQVEQDSAEACERAASPTAITELQWRRWRACGRGPAARSRCPATPVRLLHRHHTPEPTALPLMSRPQHIPACPNTTQAATHDMETLINMLRCYGYTDAAIGAMLNGTPLCYSSTATFHHLCADLGELARDIERELGWSAVRFVQTGSTVVGFSMVCRRCLWSRRVGCLAWPPLRAIGACLRALPASCPLRSFF